MKSASAREAVTKPDGPRAAKAIKEPFIGNDSETMMAEETFAEFEERMKSGEHAAPVDEDDEPETSEAPEEEEAAPPDEDDDQERGPGGRPVDREGVEWDYVTNEGVGFNDDDDEDAMSFERNGKTYFKPDFGPLRPADYEGYWKLNFALEAAMANDDDAEFEAAIEANGLRNRNHWKRVQATFLRHYGKDDEFMNMAVVVRQQESRDKLKSALKPGALDPIEGVSLQVFAALSAQQGSVQGAAFTALLKKHGLTEAQFKKGAAGWNARMSDTSNPEASMAIATEYGKAFAGAGVGQFGASAAEASESMGLNDKVAGKNVKGQSNNVTFERFVEIQSAQSAWAQQGKDVNAMLKKVFNLTAVDWSNISAMWSQKLSTDRQLVLKYGELNAKYTQKYLAS